MRTKGQVAHKMKQLMYRHLKREMKRLMKRTGSNCTHNKSLDSHPIQVCTLDCTVCDPGVCPERAVDCSKFKARHSPEDIKTSLKQFFRERSVSEIKVRFPDVASLLWVISDDEGDPQRGPLIPEGVPTVTLYGIPLWVDTQEELDTLEKISAEYEVHREVSQNLSRILDRDPQRVFSAVVDLVQEVTDLRESDRIKSHEISDLSERVTSLREQLSSVRSQDLPVSASDSRPWWRRILG